MKPHRPPKYLSEVLQAIYELKEVGGSNTLKIAKHVKQGIPTARSKPRNVTTHVQRALNHAILNGIIKKRAGKFRINTSRLDPYRDCEACRRKERLRKSRRRRSGGRRRRRKHRSGRRRGRRHALVPVKSATKGHHKEEVDEEERVPVTESRRRGRRRKGGKGGKRRRRRRSSRRKQNDNTAGDENTQQQHEFPKGLKFFTSSFFKF